MTTEIIQGHWVEELKKLPEKHFHMAVTSPPYWGLRSYLPKDHPLKPLELGSEPTVEEYVKKLVDGFREMRRVLRDDGVFWLNLGDSYNAHPGQRKVGDKAGPKQQTKRGSTNSPSNYVDDLKPKDLIGLPWLVAFALRADGWYLRSACPWVKRSTMPESVEDRPGSACETIFLFSKQPNYFYDAESVRLPGRIPAGTKGAKASAERAAANGVNSRPSEYATYSGTRNRRNSDWFWDTWQGLLPDEEGNPVAFVVNPRPYKGAHFACFPPTLIDPMIRAGTSEKGCCMLCGAPWQRIVERKAMVIDRSERSPFEGHSTRCSGHMVSPPSSKTIGWKCSCDCGVDLEPMPCRVLDPFGGAGTTAMVCKKLGRDCTIIELHPDYIPLARERVK